MTVVVIVLLCAFVACAWAMLKSEQYTALMNIYNGLSKSDRKQNDLGITSDSSRTDCRDSTACPRFGPLNDCPSDKLTDTLKCNNSDVIGM